MARPLSPLSVRLSFWEGVDAGLSVAVAAQGAGVSRPTGYRWLSEYQKVSLSPVQDFSVARVGLLSLREREEIGFQLARGQGVRRIKAARGRAPLRSVGKWPETRSLAGMCLRSRRSRPGHGLVGQEPGSWTG